MKVVFKRTEFGCASNARLENDDYTLQTNELEQPGDIIPPIKELHSPAYQKKLERNSYMVARAREYPPIGDQLDAIWDEINPTPGSKAEEIKAEITAIKAKYPKPSQL